VITRNGATPGRTRANKSEQGRTWANMGEPTRRRWQPSETTDCMHAAWSNLRFGLQPLVGQRVEARLRLQWRQARYGVHKTYGVHTESDIRSPHDTYCTEFRHTQYTRHIRSLDIQSQTYRARPTEPDIQSQTYRARHTEPDLQSQTYRARPTAPDIQSTDIRTSYGHRPRGVSGGMCDSTIRTSSSKRW
jgi:hypothetical protein